MTTNILINITSLILNYIDDPFPLMNTNKQILNNVKKHKLILWNNNLSNEFITNKLFNKKILQKYQFRKLKIDLYQTNPFGYLVLNKNDPKCTKIARSFTDKPFPITAHPHYVISDCDLQYLTHIESLSLDSIENISDLGLKYLTMIKELELKFNFIVTNKGLENLTKLEIIKLPHSHFINKICFDFLPNLKHLTYYNNRAQSPTTIYS